MLLCCGVLVFVNIPSTIYGDVFFKSEERAGVWLTLKALPETPKRFQIDIQEFTQKSGRNDVFTRAFPTRFFYDELGAVRKIVVSEEKTTPVWETVTNHERLVVDFYRNGVPRRLTEKITWVGGRELEFDPLGRILVQKVFLYEPNSLKNSNNHQGYQRVRTFRETYDYDETDVVIEKDLYENGLLQYKKTQTLPQKTESGITFRENYFDGMKQLVRYEEVSRQTISETSYREKRLRYGRKGELIDERTQYFHTGKLISEVINEEEEISYIYDDWGRLKEKKRESIRERAIAEYVQYEYHQFSGINTPLTFINPTWYSVENLRTYLSDEILNQYKVLRVHGMNPIRMVTWVKPLAERDRYPEAMVETRVEKYFLPTRMLALWFRNNVLYEKQVHSLEGKILGQYQYSYDGLGRLKESVFYGTNQGKKVSEKTVRYLYADNEEVKSKGGVISRVGNWEYFGHSLFRYLELRQQRIARMTAKDFLRDFSLFRLGSVARDSAELSKEEFADITEMNVTQYLKYLVQANLSRVLFIDEHGKVEYYLKFQNLSFSDGLGRLIIRYYRGEPAFAYKESRLVTTLEEPATDNAPRGRIQTRKGERNAFLRDGRSDINDAYAEKPIAKFSFVYNLENVLNEEETKKSYRGKFPLFAERQIYDVDNGKPFKDTTIEQSTFLRTREYSQELNNYERDFEKRIVPFIK